MSVYKVLLLFIGFIFFLFFVGGRLYSGGLELGVGSLGVGVLGFEELSSGEEFSSVEGVNLSLAFSFFISEGLSFIKNVNVVSSEAMHFMSIRYGVGAYSGEDIQRMGSRVGVDYIIYGSYSVRGDLIRVHLNIFVIGELGVSRSLLLEGSLARFSELIEDLVVWVAGSFDFGRRVVFVRDGLSRYTVSNPKTFNYLRLFVKSYNNFIYESLGIAVSYAKEVEKFASRDLNILFIIADSYFMGGDLVASLSYYKSLFKVCKLLKLRVYFCRATLRIAAIYNKQGRYMDALSLYEKVLSLSRVSNDLYMELEVFMGFGELYAEKGDYGLANSYYHKALVNARLLGDRFVESRILYFIGELFYIKGEYRSAFEWVYRVIGIQKLLSREKDLIVSYILLVSIMSSLGDIAASQLACNYADGIALSFGFSLLRARVLIRKAVLMELKGSLSLAQEYVRQSLKLQEGYKGLSSLGYSTLGLMYYNEGRFKKALYFYQRSLQINKAIAYKRFIAKDYSDIARLYVETGDYEKAFYYYGEALEIRKAIGDKLGVVITKNSFALIYINRDNDYERALGIYLDSIELMNRIDYKEGVALSYWMVGNIYVKKESYKKALHYYIRCRDIFIELGNPNYKNMEFLIKELSRKLSGGELSDGASREGIEGGG